VSGAAAVIIGGAAFVVWGAVAVGVAMLIGEMVRRGERPTLDAERVTSRRAADDAARRWADCWPDEDEDGAA
jgi:heme exporter protein D